MVRRKDIECEDPAWLNSPEKAEIDQLLREIEREERKEKKKSDKTS